MNPSTLIHSFRKCLMSIHHVLNKCLQQRAPLGAQAAKNLPAKKPGDPGSIPVWGRFPGERNANPLQYSCLENSGQGSLVGYSPRGCKELETTERPTQVQSSARSLTGHDSEPSRPRSQSPARMREDQHGSNIPTI